MIILAENTNFNLNMPQSVLPLQEADPRTSDQSRLIETINQQIWDAIAEIREMQVKALNSRFAPLDRQLDALERLKQGWDSYDAPPPNHAALCEARKILQRLHENLVLPERINASADGGVAFSLKASGNRRAQIEVLNNGEKFAHLYDLSGNSYTHDWPLDIDGEPFGNLLEPILNYMQP